MVQRDERDDTLGLCSACGADLGVDDTRAFEGGEGVVVCWECALKRGGIFDADHERWTVPPDIVGLPDERRPHA